MTVASERQVLGIRKGMAPLDGVYRSASRLNCTKTVNEIDVLRECRNQMVSCLAARQLVTANIENSQEACGLCCRKFNGEQERNNCIKRLNGRLENLDKQEASIHKMSIKVENRKLVVNMRAPNSLPYVRKGYSTYIRVVKSHALTAKTCPACIQNLPNEELGEFMSRLDRWSYVLNNRCVQDQENCPN